MCSHVTCSPTLHTLNVLPFLNVLTCPAKQVHMHKHLQNDTVGGHVYQVDPWVLSNLMSARVADLGVHILPAVVANPLVIWVLKSYYVNPSATSN